MSVRNSLILALAVLGINVSAFAASESGYENTQNAEDPFPIDASADLLPLAANEILLDIDRVGSRYIAVGVRGHVLTSTDAVNWTQSPVPTLSALTAVAFVDENNGNAVGHDAVILRTSDGGATWEQQLFSPELERPFLDIQFFDEKKGLAIGAYGLMYETSDGGANWTASKANIREDEFHLNAIVQLGDGSLLIVGEVGNMSHSTDDGKTWARVESPYDGSFFGALPHGDKGAIVYGLRGNAFLIDNIYLARGEPYGTGDVDEEDLEAAAVDDDATETAEAGEESIAAGDGESAAAQTEHVPSADAWQQLNTGTILGLLGGVALPNGDFVMVGANGKILRSAGSPGDFREIENPVGKNLSDVIVIKEGRQLLMVGEEGAQMVDLDR